MTKSDRGSEGLGLPTTVGIVNHDPTKPRAPGYSFGIRYHERIRPTPGPQYKVDWGLTPRGQGHAPSYSITGRPRRTVWDSMISGNPAPNAYASPAGLRSTWEKAAPMYSFGCPYRSNYGGRGPAPNSYSQPGTLGPRVPHLRGAPAVGFAGRGSASKGFAYDHHKTPGPAGYGPTDLGYTTRRAPVVTLKGRPKLPPIKLVTPGPGAYEAGDLNQVTRTSPRFSMGIRHGDKVNPLFTLADVGE